MPGGKYHAYYTQYRYATAGKDGHGPPLEQKSWCRFQIALSADFSGGPEKVLLAQKFELFFRVQGGSPGGVRGRAP